MMVSRSTVGRGTRGLAVLLVAVAAVLVLFGCRENSETPVATVDQTESQPTVIVDQSVDDEVPDAASRVETDIPEQVSVVQGVVSAVSDTEIGAVFDALDAVRVSTDTASSLEDYKVLLDAAEIALAASMNEASEASQVLDLLAAALQEYQIAYEAWRIKDLDVLQSNRSWREFTTEHYNIISTLGLSTLVVSDEDIDLILEHLWGEASALVSRAEDAR